MTEKMPTGKNLTMLTDFYEMTMANGYLANGYRDTIGTVFVTAALYPDGRVVIKIRDKGCGIEDIPKAMEPLYTSCQTGERAGLGFAVMQSLMDRVKVRSVPGKGTQVTLTKRITSKEAASCSR